MRFSRDTRTYAFVNRRDVFNPPRYVHLGTRIYVLIHSAYESRRVRVRVPLPSHEDGLRSARQSGLTLHFSYYYLESSIATIDE